MIRTAPTVVYGIGAQKAGTTWLYDQLSRIEGAHFPLPKELHYWDCIRAPFHEKFRLNAYRRRFPFRAGWLRRQLMTTFNVEARKAHREADRYCRIFDNLSDSHSRYMDYLGLNRIDVKMVGDFTPSYALLGRSTYLEMLASAEDVRFIFIMRDPVRRLWSGIGQRYRHALRSKQVTLEQLRKFFREALADPLHPDLLRSDYRRTINELESSVPSDRIHYVFFETLFGNDTDELIALAEFLDMSPALFDTSEQVHAGILRNGCGEEDIALAKEVLAPIYKFVQSRFGARVPESWYWNQDVNCESA